MLENVRVFDPSAGAFTKPTDILIRGDRIEATGELEPPGGPVERHDAAGRYALAGLWDSHVHLAFLDPPKRDRDVGHLAGIRRQGSDQRTGCGQPAGDHFRVEPGIKNGELVGPRVYFAGPLLSQPPLYQPLQELNRSLPGAALSVESVAGIDAILDRLVEQGATMTKAINRWEPALFRHYLDAAEVRSLRVVLDPGLPILHDVPVDRALALGVKSIEHGMAPWPAVLREDLHRECEAFLASGQSCESGNELRFRIMALGKASVSQEKLAALADTWARSGAYFCPTLLVNENWRRHPPPMPKPHPAGATQEQWRRSLQGLHEVGLMFTRELSTRGVRILVGQDGMDSEGTVKEMELLSQAGVSAVEILRGATVNPAKWLGVDDRFGSIGRLKIADILILDRNPLDRIDNIRSTWMVLRSGEPITPGKN